ncbi:hypothetical protein FOMPIDRAFT_1127865 [Fomitopsis schrenkii]|uniref:Uncharacterized protein n=1 Tax=Fomitopsis schrenkii TaxID=2126942 RepID=S8DXG1_FOMSC|nr:hypothetical protein FOMPIDRAFT_1127865 [Fomitopsis schrenkii]
MDTEKDISINQRGLVDTCFEEHQYESATVVLDQLRSPKYRPFPPHIRHLVYISLYPPTESEEFNADKLGSEPASPSKLLLRQQKTTLLPTRAARDAAVRLLFAFAQTNTPGALFAALPKYTAAGDGAVNGIQEDTDSFIARQSIRVRNAKDCWTILKDGFVQPAAEVPPLKRKGPARARVVEQTVDGDSEEPGIPTPVGQFAWPVLEWMICLLEKDETLIGRSGQPPHSPLLLSQIPPPRAATGARWDIEAPLDVIFYCLKERELRRRGLGIRLFTLLVNLSATTLVDLPLFLNGVGNRLFALNLDELTSLFAALPSSQTMLQFKVLLCKNHLSDFGAGSGQNSTRPKPQARGQPRPAPNRRKPSEPSLSENPASQAASSSPASVARKFPTIPPSEIISLVESPCSTDVTSAAQTLRVKLELALSYTLLRAHAGPGEDPEWQRVLRDGRLAAAFDAAVGLVKKTRSRTAGALDERAIEGMKQLLAVVSVC